MKPYDKAKLELQKGDSRRGSVLTASDAGSEFEPSKKIKYGGPLAGILLSASMHF